MSIRLLATGEVFPDLEDGRSAFRHVPRLFADADIVLGTLEGVYTDRPALAPSRLNYCGSTPERASMLGDAGFDVMACATNHMVDGGYRGLEDTLQLLHDQGIVPIGAGRDLSEATTPVVLDRRGVRVAFLNFCSVFPVGYEAGAERPGIAPLRIQTFYGNPFPNMWDPGVEPTITCIPLPEDLGRMHASIDAASEAADFVVVAFHWGYSAEVRQRITPASATHDRIWRDNVQDYEIEIARAAVERGADVVVCHHQATLRGVEVHADKPIFYGLGNFAHHYRHDNPHKRGNATAPHRGGEEFPYLPFTLNEPQDTGVAVFDLSGDTVRAGFVPARILPDGSTEPLDQDDGRAPTVIAHLEHLSRESGFNTRFEPGEDPSGCMLVRIGAGAGTS